MIENQAVAVPGSVQPSICGPRTRAAAYGRPMLALVSGRYPRGPGEVAVTSGVAALFGLRTGGVVDADGRALPRDRPGRESRQPARQFVLVAPGQIPQTRAAR